AQDLSRVTHIIDETDPGLVFAEQGEPFRRVLQNIADRTVVTGDGTHGRALDEFLAPTTTSGDVDGEVDDAAARVGPDHVAKILYTSGSTGRPKGVLTTHRMLCANQQSIRQIWPFLRQSPPIICDWLPWSHTFGSSHNFNMVLANGGSLYIDAGKPAPGLFETTVANLADVKPTISFNVPAGYTRLVERLETDDEVAEAFFSRLQLVFYAAAALPQDVWRRLEAVSRRITGGTVPMTSSWGLTETAPAVTAAHFALDRAGVIGTPIPGVTLKLVPANDKTEIRVAGESVTPGYFNDPERTAAAFDEEGFFITGDAVKLADPDDPNAGLVFDGRVAEDFKLPTGTWVSVGTLRPALVAATSPLLLDCVVTGHDRDWLGLLVWLAPGQDDNPSTRERLRQAIVTHNEDHHDTSSTRIRRVAILTEPPSIDAGETTDKGYINQRRVVDQRRDVIDALYAEEPGDDILVIDP
ncbi:MAG: AMP-binding protein, partial [Acidimicrobiia bacterium]|nr:AMP-binding protein [Acidimicrobiia bacterium]